MSNLTPQEVIDKFKSEARHTHANLSVLSQIPAFPNSSNLFLNGQASFVAIPSAAINFSAGTTSTNAGSVVFSNSNGITFGLTNNTITASHNGLTTAMASDAGSQWIYTSQSSLFQSAGAYLTTARASNDAVGLNTAATNVTWTINSSGISIDASGYAGTGVSATNASVTLNSNGLAISVNAGAAGSVNFSAGTTSSNLTQISFANSNGVSFGLNGGTITATVATNYQSQGAYLTTAAQSNQVVNSLNGSTGQVSLNVGSSLSASTNGSSITFGLASDITTALQSAGAYLTTARASNDAIGLNTAATNVTWTVNSGGISLNAGGYAGTGTSATNASVTLNSNGLAISVNAGGAGSVNFSAGTTSSNLTQVSFANSNGVSFGLNGGTLTATVATNYLTTARASNDAIGLNTAASNVTWTVGSNGISLNANGYAGTGTSATNASITMNSNGLAISVANPSGGNVVQHYSPPWAYSGMATNSSLGNSTLYFQPFDVYENVYASRINFYISLSGSLSAGNSTGTCSVGAGYALYTMNGTAADSRTLNLLTSYSIMLVSQSMTSNTAYRVTHYNGLANATSHTTSQYAASATNVSTYQATSVNGLRAVAFPVNSTLSAGRYWLGFSVQTVTGNAMTNNVSVAITQVAVQPYVAAWGTNSSGTNASVMRALQGWGSYSAQSAAWPNTIAFTTDAIRAAVNQTLIHFDIKGYSTSTNML